MRYLAIDYGNKRTGLAICDDSETIVSPLAVIATGKSLAKRICDIITSENVGAVVMGLPLNMDDSVGPQAKIVMAFADRLKKEVGVPIHFQDERLSSFDAEQKLAPAEFTRAGKKKRLDAVAAASILESFLEQK